MNKRRVTGSSGSHRGHRSSLVGALVAGVMLFCVAAAGGVIAAPALAASSTACQAQGCSPWWRTSLNSFPANLAPGGEGKVTVIAENVGDANVSQTFTLSVKLPGGVEAQAQGLELAIPEKGASPKELAEFFCSVKPGEVVCSIPREPEEGEELKSYADVEATIPVKVGPAAKSGDASIVVSGGGAPSVSADRPVVVSEAATQFGIEQYELVPETSNGAVDLQAGSHPFQLTAVTSLKQNANPQVPPEAVKDLQFELPPGLIGNPTPFKQCSVAQFTSIGEEDLNLCPADTAIGVESVSYVLGGDVVTESVPLFNLVPSYGEPARFGFEAKSIPVYLNTAIRTGSDYGVTVNVENITEVASIISTRTTFWGVPGDSRHNEQRGWNCLDPVPGVTGPCESSAQESPPPFLTMPTACTGPLHSTLNADSWEHPGVFLAEPYDYTFQDGFGQPVGMDGCNQVPFSPEIRIDPEGHAGSTPTGLTVDEHVPQEATSANAEGLGEADVKGLSVTLPEGVVLNPSAADGLQACTLAQIGLRSGAASGCPEASKVGTVTIKTPLLPPTEPLTGAAYLATPSPFGELGLNPFHSLVALYIYAENPKEGVVVKAAGEVLENPSTGQLTAHFERDPVFEGTGVESESLPELAFEDVELSFFGGDRAPLGTPALCRRPAEGGYPAEPGYVTTGTFTPWSETPTVGSSSEFNITSGPNSSACPNPRNNQSLSTLPFAPTLAAGSTSIQAGGFTPLTTTISREDGQQNLGAVRLQLPAGLSGVLAGVKLCPEAQANAGTCGAESEIGGTTVSVGLGGDPYSVKGGQVFLTEHYEGAPFGLSIVNPAVAGPFDLGTVVVRAKIEVNPLTAALTVTTNAQGQPYSIPHILDGIPLQIKHINVTINRSGFTFNPTDCNSTSVTGTIASVEGASKTLTVPFQATNCATLQFAPKFTASVAARTSKADGASLSVKLTYPSGSLGKQANIKAVKVDLPKQLPSRLTTLQKACVAKVFEANPAGCPAASVVGHAKAITPILPVPLEGPAYFVSHGGEAFPSLIVVLQGYGVTVDLVGTTYISHAGITSSTFKTVPDVPVGSFELTLPTGPHSALAANLPVKAKRSFCGQTLAMPTAFVAQNGQEIHESTKIATSGCAKTKKTKQKQKKKSKSTKRSKSSKQEAK